MSPASRTELSKPTPPVDRSTLHTLPISARPPHTPLLPATLFAILFNWGCLSIVATQLLVSPLGFFAPTRAAYDAIIRWTKSAFAVLCLCVIQWFAPVKVIITADEGVDLDEICVRNVRGEVVELKLPEKFVLMANHQCYLDWMYLWCMLYFAHAHSAIYIILLDRFKWIPIIGWGMQFYHFMFIKRSWIADRNYLGHKLMDLAKWAQRAGEPFVLMIYPEGTLVSDPTRALSRTYAEKMDIPDMTNMLLPRSTGLLFCLRTLLPSIPNLALVDMTVGYTGIPAAGYGQDYYTLRSVFFNGISPPTLHVHLRLWQVADLPLGAIGTGVEKGAEATQEERDAFDKWLLERWREKDRWMDGFYATGEFPPAKGGSGKGRFELELKNKSVLDVVHAFCAGVPVVAGYLLYRLFH